MIFRLQDWYSIFTLLIFGWIIIQGYFIEPPTPKAAAIELPKHSWISSNASDVDAMTYVSSNAPWAIWSRLDWE